MSPIRLTLTTVPRVPLEAEVITPDRLAGLSQAEIADLPVYHGKREHRLQEFFAVAGEGSEQIEIHGDLHRVRHVGRGMTSGEITVQGNIGMHLGAQMRGGQIRVHGNAGDWVGAEMRGGQIHVHGDAGQQTGAAYRGSLVGMRGGTILVDGNAGIEVGMRMRRGLIVINGRARDFVGLQMKGGTIVLGQGAEIRTGAWMQRGTIISLSELQLMPTFAESGRYTPTFVRVLESHLRALGMSTSLVPGAGSYTRYAGDRAVPGKGEILVWRSAPPERSAPDDAGGNRGGVAVATPRRGAAS